MEITAELISENREWIFETINKYISEPRRGKLLEFYNKYDERLTMMAASHKREYHNAFEGGYYDHVRRVITCALKLHDVWSEMEADTSTYTVEELVFSALNHDLGKMGDEDNEAYIPQTDSWRQEKLGEKYMFNTKLPFASVPDRGLYLLQLNDIKYTFNEMITIQIHDGLYDEGNKKYLMNYMPEQRPRTLLPFLIHQADLMAARIEFERDYLKTLKDANNKPTKPSVSKNFSVEKKKTSDNSKALKTIKSTSLQNMINNL